MTDISLQEIGETPPSNAQPRTLVGRRIIVCTQPLLQIFIDSKLHG
jgi:hypothetical protein